MDSKLLLSINDAAKALSVSRGTVYNLVDTGALQRVKIGSAARIPAASINAYVSRLESSTAQAVTQ